MFVALWEFEVKVGNEELFQRIYGPNGDWAALFRRDKNYRETLLLREVRRNGVYITMDTWTSREAYEAFRAATREEYELLDKACTGLTCGERKIGEYATLAAN